MKSPHMGHDLTRPPSAAQDSHKHLQRQEYPACVAVFSLHCEHVSDSWPPPATGTSLAAFRAMRRSRSIFCSSAAVSSSPFTHASRMRFSPRTSSSARLRHHADCFASVPVNSKKMQSSLVSEEDALGISALDPVLGRPQCAGLA